MFPIQPSKSAFPWTMMSTALRWSFGQPHPGMSSLKYRHDHTLAGQALVNYVFSGGCMPLFYAMHHSLDSLEIRYHQSLSCNDSCQFQGGQAFSDFCHLEASVDSRILTALLSASQHQLSEGLSQYFVNYDSSIVEPSTQTRAAHNMPAQAC